MKDGGWANTDKGWVLDPSQTARVREELAAQMARIDRVTSNYPKCQICGQKCIRLDPAGLCSKVDARHVADRAAFKAVLL
jgi:hypothetical protein